MPAWEWRSEPQTEGARTLGARNVSSRHAPARLTEVAAQCVERLANTGVKTADPITLHARNFVAASPRNSISPLPVAL